MNPGDRVPRAARAQWGRARAAHRRRALRLPGLGRPRVRRRDRSTCAAHGLQCAALLDRDGARRPRAPGRGPGPRPRLDRRARASPRRHARIGADAVRALLGTASPARRAATTRRSGTSSPPTPPTAICSRPRSIATLRGQGGLMDPTERAAFEQRPELRRPARAAPRRRPAKARGRAVTGALARPGRALLSTPARAPQRDRDRRYGPRVRVLITNDDGVEAPGLHALGRADPPAGHDVIVVAPSGERSGSGAAIGRLHRAGPHACTEVRWPELPGVPVYAIDVAAGRHGLRRPARRVRSPARRRRLRHQPGRELRPSRPALGHGRRRAHRGRGRRPGDRREHRVGRAAPLGHRRPRSHPPALEWVVAGAGAPRGLQPERAQRAPRRAEGRPRATSSRPSTSTGRPSPRRARCSSSTSAASRTRRRVPTSKPCTPATPPSRTLAGIVPAERFRGRPSPSPPRPRPSLTPPVAGSRRGRRRGHGEHANDHAIPPDPE